MQGIERTYCDVCVNSLIGAWIGLMESNGRETLRETKYGKGDTLGLDAIPEITIGGRLTEFDSHAILITEELDEQAHRRWPTDSDPSKQPLMFFSDPTDRSSQLKEFFEYISKDSPTEKIGNIMNECNPEQLWEKMFEAPVSITGATASITCVRKGEVIFSTIINYITGVIVVVTDVGIFSYKLKCFSDANNKKVNLAKITEKGKQIYFPGIRDLGYSPDDCRKFVTFLGKTVYQENFDDSMIFLENPSDFLHHEQPGGPSRPLYLSDFQKNSGPVGFIMSNGEKIGEWIHWLAFSKFAKNRNGSQALRVYEIALERPWTKNGMLMSTSPAYSLFCENSDKMYIDVSRLNNFERPSQFRCMLVILPYDNERIIHILEQHRYREIIIS